MTPAQFGLLIGGLIPAILFGISGVLQKVSKNQEVSLGAHLVAIGIGVVIVGVAICLYTPEQNYSIKRLIPSSLIGFCWGVGMTMVAFAINKYNAPLSQLTPLYNMNTIVTVLIALIAFAEWKEVNLVKLSIGTLLIVGGGILVSS